MHLQNYDRSNVSSRRFGEKPQTSKSKQCTWGKQDLQRGRRVLSRWSRHHRWITSHTLSRGFDTSFRPCSRSFQSSHQLSRQWGSRLCRQRIPRMRQPFPMIDRSSTMIRIRLLFTCICRCSKSILLRFQCICRCSKSIHKRCFHILGIPELVRSQSPKRRYSIDLIAQSSASPRGLGRTHVCTSIGRCGGDRRWCEGEVADALVRMMAWTRAAVQTKLYGAVGGWQRSEEEW
jgi:hypothetical protein